MVTRQRFEELVADALDGLPAWVLERMENVEVVVADVPPPDQRNLLGLYHGIPLTKRGRGYTSVLPDTITLYRSTIVGSVRNEDELRARIAHTVEHEVAHYFGISDDRLREMDRY
jgi:predicted Zn-dependent protease with MMP-like domain